MEFTTLGALVGLIIAIILIIKKVHPAYSLILGALIGGIVGGGGLTDTVGTMVSGAQSMMSSVLRILTSGILAGALIKTGAAEKIADVFTDYISLTGVIRVYRDCSYGFHIPKYLSEKTKNASGIGNPEEERSFGYPPAEIKADGAYAWYEQKTHTKYCYGIVTYRKGNVIYYTLASSNDDENYVQGAKNRLKRAAETGFEKLHEAHK